MPSFKSTVKVKPEEEIKKRLLELFDTIDELNIFFNSILPENSLLKSILKIDDEVDKEKLCGVLVSYLGEHFFNYVSTVRSDDKGNDQKSKNIVYKIREILLEKICSKHHDPDTKRKEILNEFNKTHKAVVSKQGNFENISDMVKNRWFLSNHKWQQNLCLNILRLPLTVIARPEGEPASPETVPMKKTSSIKTTLPLPNTSLTTNSENTI